MPIKKKAKKKVAEVKEPVMETPAMVPELEEKEEIKPEEIVSHVVEQEAESVVVAEPKVKRRFSFKKIFGFLLVLLLGGVLGGGLVVYMRGTPKCVAPVAVIVTPTPTAMVTEVPVDLTKYTVAVLNGGKIKGAASKLKDNLSSVGFTVASAGNASGVSVAKTVIQAKAGVEANYLKKLTDFLSTNYTLEQTVVLPESAKTDVVVTIGTE